MLVFMLETDFISGNFSIRADFRGKILVNQKSTLKNSIEPPAVGMLMIVTLKVIAI